ncbi:uncharacterized protein J3D65DRAFT_322269 [Phyllosticta citribraziliensis]|uniref:Uncharacterized protein n=1 Tax=Phyllosticta citribraziliensis TaxID=989973 RepID=A0ABR1LWX8_9PEZI
MDKALTDALKSVKSKAEFDAYQELAMLSIARKFHVSGSSASNAINLDESEPEDVAQASASEIKSEEPSRRRPRAVAQASASATKSRESSRRRSKRLRVESSVDEELELQDSQRGTDSDVYNGEQNDDDEYDDGQQDDGQQDEDNESPRRGRRQPRPRSRSPSSPSRSRSPTPTSSRSVSPASSFVDDEHYARLTALGFGFLSRDASVWRKNERIQAIDHCGPKGAQHYRQTSRGYLAEIPDDHRPMRSLQQQACMRQAIAIWDDHKWMKGMSDFAYNIMSRFVPNLNR